MSELTDIMDRLFGTSVEESVRELQLQLESGQGAFRQQAAATAAWQPRPPRKHVESRVIEPKQITGETK